MTHSAASPSMNIGRSYEEGDIPQTREEKMAALTQSLEEVEDYIDAEKIKLAELEAVRSVKSEHPYLREPQKVLDQRSNAEIKEYEATLSGLRTLQLERDVLELMSGDVEQNLEQLISVTALNIGGAWSVEERIRACEKVQSRIELLLGIDLLRDERIIPITRSSVSRLFH